MEVQLDAMARELATIPPMEIVFSPLTAFQLAGLLQLALRHPGVSPELQKTARRFLEAVRSHFHACPTLLDVLARGDDPAYDQPLTFKEDEEDRA